jgi:hypothetical protein
MTATGGGCEMFAEAAGSGGVLGRGEDFEVLSGNTGGVWTRSGTERPASAEGALTEEAGTNTGGGPRRDGVGGGTGGGGGTEGDGGDGRLLLGKGRLGPGIDNFRSVGCCAVAAAGGGGSGSGELTDSGGGAPWKFEGLEDEAQGELKRLSVLAGGRENGNGGIYAGVGFGGASI